MFLLLTVSLIMTSICPAGNASLDRKSKFVKAESFYLNNDLFMSEKILKNIIKEPVVDDVKFKAILTLIDIAQKEGDRSLFKDVLSSLRGIDKNTSNEYNSVLYAIGKYLLQNAEYKTAIGFLNLVDKKSQIYPQTVYIKASCFAGIKRYSDAIFNYEIVIRMKNEYINKDIRDAAILGKARVYVMMKKYDLALDEYQSIDSLSKHYIRSLEETARLFLAKKDYDQALSQLEALVLINKKLYLPKKLENTNDEESLSDLNLIKLKTLQGYLYIDQQRYDESKQVFDEVMAYYKKIKKEFNDGLNKFKLSEDLTLVTSNPYSDGLPRSLVINPEFVLFGSDDKYSQAFRDWLTEKEKRKFLSSISLYYSVLQRTISIEKKKGAGLSDEEKRLVQLKNVMRNQMNEYVSFLIKRINSRLDELGLKAQLGEIDIVWRTKEDQTKSIRNVQEKKQQNLQKIENKYRKILE